MSSSTGLRRFVSGPPAAAQASAAQPETTQPETTQQKTERCDLCATEVPAEHGHLADLDTSRLMCACRACYLLFTSPEAGRGRYRTVPDRYLADPGHTVTAADWDELQIPVGLAFFLRSSRRDEISGFYPSPAGATECQLDLAAWDRLAARHPLLHAAEPDVEAVLFTREGPGCFVVPVDACYELAGRIRLHWRGFDGGAEARQAIADFLDSVRGRSRPLPRET
ncbi:MAG TPA: DUF5947 family protein [Streptosporangiaceae bacterium]